MATFSVSMLTLIVLLAAAASAAASAVEIVNPGECKQIGRHRLISSCRRYLMDGSRFELRHGNEGNGWREEFPQCCEQLEQISEECRCEAVEQVVQEAQQIGVLQGREMREMLKTAQSLPSLCRVPPQYCENIRGDSLF